MKKLALILSFLCCHAMAENLFVPRVFNEIDYMATCRVAYQNINGLNVYGGCDVNGANIPAKDFWMAHAPKGAKIVGEEINLNASEYIFYYTVN